MVLIKNTENSVKKENELVFPKGFLWGTSTSAYQIEGGIKNDWSEWEKIARRLNSLKKKGKDIDEFICDKGCDSYNRYKEDVALAADLNTNAIRFGLEWARIQPEKDSWNIEALNHYRKLMEEAKAKNLKVVLTIWHWTNPLWLAEEGGWTSKDVVDCFAKYVDVVIKELGSYVDYWVVLNEPMVHISNGYLTAKFPPHKRNPFKAKKVFKNLVEAHKKAYELIHHHFPRAQVSITQLTNDFEPARKWFLPEIIIAKIARHYWNDKFLDKIKNHLDYIGLDYYFHDRMVWYPPFKRNKNKMVTDMGWEIYPEGIYHVLKYLSKFKKPIFILENGLADKEDKYRAEFIKSHLSYVHKAIEEGVDVRGYFYWSLLDNFEWGHGYGPKFGLYEVNRKTFARTKRPSALVYADICKNNKLTM